MEWSTVFSAANILAMIAWVVLILLPRHPIALAGVLYLGAGLLSMVYAVALGGVLSGFIPAGEGGAGANFTSIEGVRDIFASDGGVTIGWVHYLAFDLFVGLWIARDGDAKFISRFIQAPILLLTFVAGPAGLLFWLIIREPSARAKGRWN
ncbi:ABA4-like family protein [Qipengyuania sp. S6317L1]|uniref:ABA4-like family protein n=1 Tax=Qipengyuania sp. S6317L1 TaxID=2926410 RepID=UPI001FF50374|nr:ABA4-like family protein [Qipengyuania sp. S6317L1]MCK0100190.1 ABA4-like family protein [Qipengyuania sp. S6317L1]